MRKIFTHPFILSLLIIAGLIVVNNQGWLNSAKDLFYSLITPGQGFSYRVSFQFDKFFGFISSISQLEQDNTQLKKENQELLGRVAQLQEAARENEILRQQLDLPESKIGRLVLANVIGQDSSNLRKYFLINKGTEDEVRQGMAVIAAGNLLVGRVAEVTESFSKVQSIIDSNSRVNTLIQESGMTGLVKGEQGLSLIIDLLPQGEAIEESQLVITSGLAGLFPSGLLVGQVEKVVSSDVQISQTARLKPAVDFERLEKVFVIRE